MYLVITENDDATKKLLDVSIMFRGRPFIATESALLKKPFSSQFF